MFFFFNDTATTEIYTLSLHDALPIYAFTAAISLSLWRTCSTAPPSGSGSASLSSPMNHIVASALTSMISSRSEEHTSELQSRQYLVCRLLLEKKNISLYLYPSLYNIS